MEKLRELLEQCLGQNFVHMIISNPRKLDAARKIDVRPYEERGSILFQFSEYRNNQVFHQNRTKEEALEQILKLLAGMYRQMEFRTAQKQYILPENEPVPFLVELGVQTGEGKIRDKKYKKFRQINRFLEFIRDVLPELPNNREITIVDFGCGKSYLTFAMYYFLKIQRGYQVRMIGLDLKSDVIRHCNELAQKFGYEELTFLEGDISSFEGVEEVDMVVTLHACDTATDFALDKAVRWGAGVILSVPCCQHEVNRQIQSELLQPVLKYGLIKERMSALLTDAVRANLLEQQGYAVQILEFIEMEHTPKNLLIRAVKTEKKHGNDRRCYTMCKEFGICTTLEDLWKWEE